MIYIMIKYKMQGQSCSLKHYDIFDSLFSKKKLSRSVAIKYPYQVKQHEIMIRDTRGFILQNMIR